MFWFVQIWSRDSRKPGNECPILTLVRITFYATIVRNLATNTLCKTQPKPSQLQPTFPMATSALKEPNFYQMTFLPDTNQQPQPQSHPPVQNNISPFTMQSLPNVVGASIASGLSSSPGNGSMATLLQNYQAAITNPNPPQFHSHSLQGMINPSQYAMSPYVQYNQSTVANSYSPFIHNFQGATAYTIDNEIAQRILQNAAFQASSAAASYPNVLSNLTMAGFQGFNTNQPQPMNMPGLPQLSGVNASYLNQRLPVQLPQETLMSSASLGFAQDAANVVAGNTPTTRQSQVSSVMRSNQIAPASLVGNNPAARQFQLSSASRSNPLPMSAAPNDPMIEEFSEHYLQYFNSTGNGHNAGNSGGTGEHNNGDA